jgi:hypothetical protein
LLERQTINSTNSSEKYKVNKIIIFELYFVPFICIFFSSRCEENDYVKSLNKINLTERGTDEADQKIEIKKELNEEENDVIPVIDGRPTRQCTKKTEQTIKIEDESSVGIIKAVRKPGRPPKKK